MIFDVGLVLFALVLLAGVVWIPLGIIMLAKHWHDNKSYREIKRQNKIWQEQQMQEYKEYREKYGPIQL